MEKEALRSELQDVQNQLKNEKRDFKNMMAKMEKGIDLLKEENTDLESYVQDLRYINQDFEGKNTAQIKEIDELKNELKLQLDINTMNSEFDSSISFI